MSHNLGCLSLPTLGSSTSKSPMSASQSSGDGGDGGDGAGGGMESKLIGAKIIHATWDIAPYPDGDTPLPFLFWDMKSTTACASLLIKRYAFVFMSPLIVVFIPYMIFVYKNQMGHENENMPLY
jgi:hypothetical protein